jgi:DNA modification methylase
MSEGNDDGSTDLKYPAPDRDISFQILEADARDIPVDDNSADLVVTSPPYWQKRDYGFDEQIGQEETPEAFVDTIIDCMDEWRRVLRPTGSIFLNIGDTYHKRSLTGVPELLVQAARKDGWLLRNKILWAKDGGMPEPAKNRLANRHEYVFHFTQDNDYYYDLFGYSKAFGNGSNPGDVWHMGHDRNTGGHLAPFPEEMAERCITLGAPPAICTECGKPREREYRRTTKLDTSRPQAKRATEIYEESDLTEEHIRAIQAYGISDTGKAREIQDGTGRNAEEVNKLAEEAKEVLGGYFREFTFPKKETAGWTECDWSADYEPGVVLDPFMGLGTVLQVAARMGFSSMGVDLDPPEDFQLPIGASVVKK